jgi:uncharacterized protein (DUF697 family)
MSSYGSAVRLPNPDDARTLFDPSHLLRGLPREATQPKLILLSKRARADLKTSRRNAQHAVAVAVGISAAAGAIPLPFADAIVITGAQVCLVQAVTQCYHHPPVAKDLSVLGSIGLGLGMRQLGKYVAAELVKLIPGAGTVVGGAVNATVGASGTAIAGYTWIGVCEYVARHDVGPLDEFLSAPLAKVVLAELNRRAAAHLVTTLFPGLGGAAKVLGKA